MQTNEITAVVLCGGTGTRLGGLDKPLLPVGGRPLVEHVIAALRPQVGAFVISSGRDRAPYVGLGYPTVADEVPGEGPLGGIVSAIGAVATDWLLVHPGDAPFAHASLVTRLAPAAEAHGVAVPHAGAQRQNLVLLMARPKADELATFYRRGGRAVRQWLDEQRVPSVDLGDVADSFFNVNTAADLAACEMRLQGIRPGARRSPRPPRDRGGHGPR